MPQTADDDTVKLTGPAPLAPGAAAIRAPAGIPPWAYAVPVVLIALLGAGGWLFWSPSPVPPAQSPPAQLATRSLKIPPAETPPEADLPRTRAE